MAAAAAAVTATAAALLTVVATAVPPRVKNETSTEAAHASPSPTPRPPVGDSGGLLGLGLPALYRALFVLAALAGLGLLYYVGGRVIRIRKPPRKKYGLLSNSDDHMEMASLESDEDTVFETRNLRR